MQPRRVILKFHSFEDRDRWLSQRSEERRTYRRDPWVAMELPADEVERLKEDRKDVEVFADVQMSPF